MPHRTTNPTLSARSSETRSTRPAAPGEERPEAPLCPYAAVVLGHPTLRLKTLLVVGRDGRRVLSTMPVVETTGYEASGPQEAA